MDGQLVFGTKLNTDGIDDGLNNIDSKASKLGSALGKSLAAGADALGAIGKSAISAYADYEQLTGGIETLFKGAYGTVMTNAQKAFKTCGLSANEYMENVTGFSASLIQSLGGNTTKAAQYADIAMQDMSDNANKMGTNMSMITNAYQGFAKQNYTMLDNLKLGYGGTKQEMERLLKDAQKISGIKFNIDSFADVVQAIHVIQENMGITGTTAQEAASTISGSINMMKAAWKNLLVGMADGSQDLDQLIDDFCSSLETVADNVVPIIVQAAPRIIQAVGEIFAQLLPVVVQLVGQLVKSALAVIPQLISQGNYVTAIIMTIVAAILVLNGVLTFSKWCSGVASVVKAVVAAVPAIMAHAGAWLASAAAELAALAPYILIAAAIAAVVAAIVLLVKYLYENNEGFRNFCDNAGTAIKEFGQKVADGFRSACEKTKGFFTDIKDGATQFIQRVRETFQNVAQVFAPLTNAFRNVVTTIRGVFSDIASILGQIADIFRTIFQGIVQTVAQHVSNIVNSIRTTLGNVAQTVQSALSPVTNLFQNVFGNVISAVTSWGSNLVAAGRNAVSNFCSSVVNGLKNLVSSFVNIGADMVNGLVQGFTAKWDAFVSKVTGKLAEIKKAVADAFNIHSPSRWFKWVAEMCVAGWDNGWDKFGTSSVSEFADNVKSSFGTVAANGNGGARTYTQIINVNQQISTPDELARAIRNDTRMGLMTGVA